VTTYIVRHARTDYNERNTLNSSPTVSVGLDHIGRAHSIACSTLPWSVGAACVVTSELPRARETAGLLRGFSVATCFVDARLNEIDYGWFEGRSWSEYGTWLRDRGPDSRPAGAAESWNDAMDRVLDSLLETIDLPSPRIIVGHGFWVSALRCIVDGRPWPHVADIGTVGHLEPTTFADADLRHAINRARMIVRCQRGPTSQLGTNP
jgi:2,3-bisphosphoglycerate-dependent phosphoglycerate mutase